MQHTNPQTSPRSTPQAAQQTTHGLAPQDTLEQDYAAYTDEAHAVWRVLHDRRIGALELTASQVFLDGVARIGLAADRVPDLADINRRLGASTGWNAVGVKGFIPAERFFGSLAARRFPTTLIVRPRAQLDYLPEPDIFHDVFGHVPLHADPVFGDFLQRFGVLAAGAATPEETLQMARLFWFTVEFGLVNERGRTRIYGSGLISSHGDAANALGPKCDRRPFELDAVISQPFEIDRLQDVLFEVDSFDQLFEAVETLSARRQHRPPLTPPPRNRLGLSASPRSAPPAPPARRDP